MFNKLIELIKEALRKMVAYKGVKDVIDDAEIYSIAPKLRDAINKWKDIYKDESPWLDEKQGLYSLGLGKEICQSLKATVLSEMTFSIADPNNTNPEEENENTRAFFLNKQVQQNLMKSLGDRVEMGMAVGGIIIKPYVSGEHIYFDYCRQGSFIPIAFDDEGNITDIAFTDQFRADGSIYTKIERQTFIKEQDEEGNITGRIVVENKAFKAKVDENANEDEDSQQELGNEIPLEMVNKWADIEPEVVIENVEKPLFGFYRVPLANNIDLDSPLGISIFSPAVNLIRKADEQFSRLDWEYEGGQLAIDVDRTALQVTEGYYGTTISNMDKLKNRLYRKLDLGQDDTYNAFVPTLRDANYMEGLNSYLARIEDLVGLARGTISSNAVTEAMTATEIKMLKQRTFVTISDNQSALQSALEDVVYAMNVLTDLYELAPDGDYSVNIEWSDSILSDTDTELNQKMMLLGEGVLSKAEVRAWYTGEDLETAQNKIDEIAEEQSNALMGDIFTQNGENTLES